jgi:hypothetical protein
MLLGHENPPTPVGQYLDRAHLRIAAPAENGHQVFRNNPMTLLGVKR